MFRSAIVKLTLWYLLIIMLMSAFFSFALYGALNRELNVNVRGQIHYLQSAPPGPPPGNRRESFDNLRRRQLDQSTKRIRTSLLLFNLLILITGAGASYLLARRTLRPIQDALDAQSRFTADASHELRTPLTAMKAEIEVALKDGKLSQKETTELLKSNLEEIAQLEMLSSSLLQLADYENGASTTNRQACRLKMVMSEVEKKLRGLAKQHDVKLSFAVGDALVAGDPSRLRELFVILVDNAIKYSGDGKQVGVAVAELLSTVQVSVVDQGVGIKASHIPHLFNRFYRADTSRSARNISGYGLGLSLAKQIVEAHRGKIEVESTPGQGSVFRVTLPKPDQKKGISHA